MGLLFLTELKYILPLSSNNQAKVKPKSSTFNFLFFFHLVFAVSGVITLNRPCVSCLMLLFQCESLCKTFDMNMSLICMKRNLRWNSLAYL